MLETFLAMVSRTPCPLLSLMGSPMKLTTLLLTLSLSGCAFLVPQEIPTDFMDVYAMDRDPRGLRTITLRGTYRGLDRAIYGIGLIYSPGQADPTIGFRNPKDGWRQKETDPDKVVLLLSDIRFMREHNPFVSIDIVGDADRPLPTRVVFYDAKGRNTASDFTDFHVLR